MVTDSWRTQTDRRWEYKTANRCQSTRLPTWSFLLTLRREWWTCTPVKPTAFVGGINFSRLLANFPRKISKRNIRNNCCHEKHGLFTNGYPYRFLSLEFHLIFSLADRSLFWTLVSSFFCSHQCGFARRAGFLGCVFLWTLSKRNLYCVHPIETLWRFCRQCWRLAGGRYQYQSCALCTKKWSTLLSHFYSGIWR